MEQVAGLLGQPLMPWQRDVLDVALEVDSKTGLLVYRQVVLTVPRQSGKTWLLLCLMVHRALGFGEPQEIIYTAQNRLEARKKWEDDHVRRLERSPLRHKFKVRRQLGQESIRWENGSLHSIASSTERSGHGATLDLAVLDEAFAHEDARLEQALKPAMITRPEPQMWIVSTAGTGKSSFLRGKVDAGRAKAVSGLREDSAYFEWSAPGDADPADPATWWAHMPALGQTIDEDVIRSEFRAMDLLDFRRAYLNQWPDIGGTGVLDVQAWRALADPASQPGDSVAFAVDTTPDRDWSSIAVAGVRGDGLVHVEVVDRRPGTEWVVDRLLELQNRWWPDTTLIDPSATAGSLIPDLKAAGVDLDEVTMRRYAQACGQFYDAVAAGTLRHLGQPELDEAVANATQRPMSDAWAWARKKARGDISPLVAATLAFSGFVGSQPLSPGDIHIVTT